MIARIRINPKDCLGILDIMQSCGINPYERSFSHSVSFALSSLIAVARKGGIIPTEEDGFQYLNRMGPLFDQVSTKVKREQTDAMYQRAVHGIDSVPVGALKEGDFYPVKEDFDREAGMQEYQVLKKKIMADEDMSEEEIGRFEILQNKLY